MLRWRFNREKKSKSRVLVDSTSDASPSVTKGRRQAIPGGCAIYGVLHRRKYSYLEEESTRPVLRPAVDGIIISCVKV